MPKKIAKKIDLKKSEKTKKQDFDKWANNKRNGWTLRKIDKYIKCLKPRHSIQDTPMETVDRSSFTLMSFLAQEDARWEILKNKEDFQNYPIFHAMRTRLAKFFK